MKAGIVLDDWKLPVFRKRLTEAGFEYTDAGGMTHDTTVLHVVIERSELEKLQRVLEEAHAECRRAGKPKRG